MKDWKYHEVQVLKSMKGRFRTVDIAKRVSATTEEVEAKIKELEAPTAPAEITADHEAQLAWVVGETHKLLRAESYGSVTVFIDKGRVSRIEQKISIMNPSQG
jgi:hypothetical protein